MGKQKTLTVKLKTIEMPLSYAMASEEVANALSSLLEDGLSVENVRAAKKILKKHCGMGEKLPQNVRDALSIWM